MRREAACPGARVASAPGLAFAPAFGGDLDLVVDLRGLLARDVPFENSCPWQQDFIGDQPGNSTIKKHPRAIRYRSSIVHRASD
jgi:hypothetical protein